MLRSRTTGWIISPSLTATWREMQQADMAFVANQDTSYPIKKKPLNTLRADELHTIFINKNPEGSPLKVT